MPMGIGCTAAGCREQGGGNVSGKKQNLKGYRFSLDPERDADLANRLDAISPSLRGDYIKTAIRYFIKAGEWKAQLNQPTSASIPEDKKPSFGF